MTTLSLLDPTLIAQLSPILPDDERFMAMAINEAEKGEFTTRPNPAVGCVIVKNNLIIGKGFHPKAGYPHAEVFALNDVKNNGQDIEGATAYVTLEPCSHFGRTPPCAGALIKSGVARVVIATLDPNPQVAGKGVEMLLNASISVSLGVCEREAKELNKGFLKAMATGLPFVRLKMGISLDGRIAMQNGQSKWMTGELSRRDVQNLRAKSGAIITGSNTIIADNPALTVRLPDVELDNIGTTAIPQPKIVVIDRCGRLSPDDDFTVLKNPNTMIWQDDLPALLKTLVAKYQCHDVLVETGATLATSFLSQNLVDELIIYQAPCLLGVTARPMFGGQFERLQDKLNFTLVDVERLGDDVKMIFLPKNLSTT
ncbi:Riboflavin biosynthesis protein RibD [Moraxella lacunata]|uniref:Riboflavin biosynthesis protein RibD n=1 Tax=Moraxella lacunata TaxID=477 RepID=A0A378TQG0_MORLA|nr:bifunctional diaminohydroxyphosphoribosylaminopyrimidine deaminase/5-amino-6-(5-phosphoribosylamino)uracil reductase RibD [Moraxella lacunata]STZ63028.1 Riboflavin biosynthesis protein RibD [Moraxella lacunata]